MKSCIARRPPTEEVEPGLSYSEQFNELLKQKYQIFDSQKPRNNYPQFPENLHELPLDEIGQLQAKYTAWANYIDELLAVQIGNQAYVEDQRDYSETMTRLQSGSKKLYDKRDTAKANAREKYEKALETTAMVELLKAKFRSCERSLKTLSRELSRRGLQVQIDG